MSSAPKQSQVVNNDSASRFEIEVEGGLAFSQYRRTDEHLVFTHTEVPAESEGQGVGNQLARASLDFARAEDLRVVPQCRFIAAFIKRHPEYQDLVDESG